MLDKILTKAELTKLVEKLVRDERMSYMEAVLHICEERSIDPLDIGKIVERPIRNKIEIEAQQLNMLPGKSTSTLKDFFSKE